MFFDRSYLGSHVPSEVVATYDKNLSRNEVCTKLNTYSDRIDEYSIVTVHGLWYDGPVSVKSKYVATSALCQNDKGAISNRGFEFYRST